MIQKESLLTHGHTRDPLFDVAKALMMLWVVWGHFSRWGVVAGPLEPSPYMSRTKILLNMPVFFVIGGYLSFSTLRKGSWSKIIARIVGFLWPMATFGLVFALVLIVMKGWHGWGLIVWYPIKHVIYEHWFLRTFAVIYLLSAFIYRCLPNDRFRWIGFACIWCACLLLTSRFKIVLVWLGGSQTMYMFPFFIFGLMALRLFPLWRFTHVALTCTALVLIVVAIEGDSFAFRMNFWNAPSHWRDILFDPWNLLAFFGRMSVGLAGTVSILWGINCLLSHIPQIAYLATFGTTTLGVYIIHEWPLIQIGKTGLSFLPLTRWSRWPLALGWFLLCHYAVMGIRRIPKLRILFFGDEQRLASIIEYINALFRNRVHRFCV
jgi:fucose 4-O-acetylase-like acetyltransferase